MTQKHYKAFVDTLVHKATTVFIVLKRLNFVCVCMHYDLCVKEGRELYN